MTIVLAAAQAPHKLPVGNVPGYLGRPRKSVKALALVVVFAIALIAVNFTGLNALKFNFSHSLLIGQIIGQRVESFADSSVILVESALEKYRAQELSYAYVGNLFVNIQDVFSSAELIGRLLTSAGSRSNLDKDISSVAAERFGGRVSGEFIEKGHPSNAFGFFSAAISGKNPGKIFMNGSRGSLDNAALDKSLSSTFQNTPSSATGTNGLYSLPAGVNTLQEGAWIYLLKIFHPVADAAGE
ncbi:MAG: hypothetical protein Q8N81_00845 [bacterium]|nr:hypothetical protein [bacterium]